MAVGAGHDLRWSRRVCERSERTFQERIGFSGIDEIVSSYKQPVRLSALLVATVAANGPTAAVHNSSSRYQ